MRWSLGILAVAVICCLPPRAAAQPEAPPVAVDGMQVLGPGTPTNPGWFSCSLRLTNASPNQIEGTVELISELSWSRDSCSVTTQAPFAVPAGGSVTLQLPTHGYANSPPQLRAVARDTAGGQLFAVDLPDPRSVDPVLFSLATPIRVAPWLRGQQILAGGRNPLRGSYDLPTLEFAVPQVQAASGELVLPERPAGYASATVVLAPSAALARITDQQRQALADWVLAGGALAVAITRPEDLRAPMLTALVGSGLEVAAPPQQLLAPRVFLVPPDPSGVGAPTHRTARPGDAVASTLVGHRGGNLRPTPWGAAATYGLGEVHILGFDPTVETVANDPWVHLQIKELVRHAWDRKLQTALPHGESALDLAETQQIRRLLDPNEGTRWSIAVATLILLLYAVLAGPLSFHLAARRGRPLRALWQLPIWSFFTLLIVVGLGMLAKGIRGEARHLTLIESGAGISRAAVTRFRAFYSPASSELTVSTAEYGNVLDVAGPTNDTGRVLVVDRDGARLEHFRAKPWQTVLVREDGFTRVGDGVSLTASGADIMVKNRTGRDLVGVLVRRPNGDATFFERVRDGESVAASDGETVSGVRLPTRGGLGLGPLLKRLNNLESKLGDAWQAVGAYSYYHTHWWPDGVPTLIAQLAGGEGKRHDSGLRLSEDRVLLRIVGFGGAP